MTGSVVAVEAPARREVHGLPSRRGPAISSSSTMSDLFSATMQLRDANLAGEKNVLTGLGHRAVGGGDHEDRTVHLGGTGDHVLDVVSVTGGIDVCVVTLVGLVLDVRDVDGDAALALLGSVVNAVESR